jgi:hypothetical protein
LDSSQFSGSFTETVLMIKKLVTAPLVVISDPFSATMHYFLKTSLGGTGLQSMQRKREDWVGFELQVLFP